MPDDTQERALKEAEDSHSEPKNPDELANISYPPNAKKDSAKTKTFNQFWQNVRNNDFS